MLDYKKIGSRILQLRKNEKMTQVELSAVLGISHQAISKWENGESLPDIEQLLRLAKLFHQTMEQILLGDEGAEELPAKLHVQLHPDKTTVDSPDTLWSEVLNEIKKQINERSYSTWFQHANGRLEDETFIISSPNPFSNDWLLNKYSLLIAETVAAITGNTNIQLKFQTAAPANYNKYKTN